VPIKLSILRGFRGPEEGMNESTRELKKELSMGYFVIGYYVSVIEEHFYCTPVRRTARTVKVQAKSLETRSS
jgi:hypothetical protein